MVVLANRPEFAGCEVAFSEEGFTFGNFFALYRRGVGGNTPRVMLPRERSNSRRAVPSFAVVVLIQIIAGLPRHCHNAPILGASIALSSLTE